MYILNKGVEYSDGLSHGIVLQAVNRVHRQHSQMYQLLLEGCMVQEGYEALVQVEELEEEFMGLEGVFHVAEHHKLAFCI